MKSLCLALLVIVFSDLSTPAANPPPTLNEPNAVANAIACTNPAVSSLLDEKHKLVPGDKISFQILEDKKPVKSLIVTDSGEVNFPYIGLVAVADKTCLQVAQEIKVPLEREYYYRATVIIGLDVASKVVGRVYVVGQVRIQGAIEIPSEEDFTVGKAILCAGGFGDFADKRNITLVRAGSEGTKQVFQLNMVDVLEKGQTEMDKTLEKGDFIIVPSRLVNF
ncbi:MAG: polysaccharide biosynthesis/export family protein [Verrucomicrobiota bacterium]|jgi:polysaccharide export outer membrane protein